MRGAGDGTWHDTGKRTKDQINGGLVPPERGGEAVSREVGVRAERLERWRAQALAGASGERGGGVQRWTVRDLKR